jgi:hypothetical protein
MNNKNEIIKSKPLMICSNCCKENCNGDCFIFNRLYKWFKGIILSINSIICSFIGHEYENYITETDTFIATVRCKRCHSIVMDMETFHFKSKKFPPPNSSDEEIKKWEAYCDNKINKLKNR